MTPLARTGTAKKRFRPTRGRRAIVVDLIRRAGERMRVFLDDVARLDLRPAVGDRFACELYFEESRNDGEPDDIDALAAVTVTAVHDRGFVDLVGYPAFVDGEPLDVMLRRYPERLEWKVS